MRCNYRLREIIKLSFTERQCRKGERGKDALWSLGCLWGVLSCLVVDKRIQLEGNKTRSPQNQGAVGSDEEAQGVVRHCTITLNGRLFDQGIIREKHSVLNGSDGLKVRFLCMGMLVPIAGGGGKGGCS